MTRRRWFISPLALCVGAGLGIPSASAQPGAPTSSAQPTLPQPMSGDLSSDIVKSGGSGGSGTGRKPLVVHKKVARHAGHRHRVRPDDGEPLERPALAGVQLVAPIPHPLQPPHFTVPTPAYPLENIATFYTTPPPPVVCARVPRDPDAPDPHLVRERTVVCAADNP